MSDLTEAELVEIEARVEEWPCATIQIINGGDHA